MTSCQLKETLCESRQQSKSTGHASRFVLHFQPVNLGIRQRIPTMRRALFQELVIDVGLIGQDDINNHAAVFVGAVNLWGDILAKDRL